MSGQFVNPIGADLYGLQSMGGVSNPAPQGYLQSRTPVGLDADTFETSKPKKPDRLLLKWFNKSDTFFKAGVNSLTAAVGGVGNYFRSMVWSKEEGFFRGLKTAATIVGFGLAASAGFMLAPTFTAAALAGLTAFGVGAGTLRFGWNGLKWIGSMMSGKYNRAVESAHDSAEALTDVATNLTGARQATNAVMRLTDKTGTSNNPFNMLKMFGDLWDTVGNRNFLRTGFADARLRIADFKSRIKLYAEHEEIVKNFELLQIKRQQVNQGKAVNTYSKVYDIDGNKVYDNPLLHSDRISYHATYQTQQGSKTKTYMRVKVEMGAKESPTAMNKTGREFESKYYDVLLDDMPNHGEFRLNRNKVKDGSLYENDMYQFENRAGFTFDPNGQRSEFFLGRWTENSINLATNALKSLGTNFFRPIKQKAWGTSFDDVALATIKNGKPKARVFNPTASKVDDIKAVQTFTAREIDQANFYNVPYDGQIQPTMMQRIGGLFKAIVGYSDENGMHAGLFTNPEVLRASNITRTNRLDGTEEARVVTEALTRHHGYLDNPEIYLYNKIGLNNAGTCNIRQYLVRAGGRDYLITYEVPVKTGLKNSAIASRLEENPTAFIQSSIHESETSRSGIGQRIQNWYLNRSEKNKPVYNIEVVPSAPTGVTPRTGISRTAISSFIDGETNALRRAFTIGTMDSNMVSTGIVGAKLSKIAPGTIKDADNDDNEESEADSENAQSKSAALNYQPSPFIFNPFSGRPNAYTESAVRDIIF